MPRADLEGVRSMKQPKYPFHARITTEHGGASFKRCASLEEAVKKAQSETIPGIKIVRRYVTDTKGNVIQEVA